MVNPKNVVIATLTVTQSLTGNDRMANKMNLLLPSSMKIELYTKYHALIGIAFWLIITLPWIILFNYGYNNIPEFKNSVDNDNHQTIQQTIEQIKLNF
jgi:hypothetical protein